jgi:phosphoribosylanthranilate isomerase
VSLNAEVKICGLRAIEHLEAAIAAGASYYGMVFFPRSPRNIALQQATVLSRAGCGRIKSVALTVDAGDAEIDAIIAAADPDFLQLHGAETPARAAQIGQRTGRPIIKAISVEREGDATHARAYDGAADLILFDAKPPRGTAGALPGGNGVAFDWRLLSPLRGTPFMLSGGLNPGNVAEAIALTGAAVVDVSSGVETAPGEKDAALIHQFVRASRASALEEIVNG